MGNFVSHYTGETIEKLLTAVGQNVESNVTVSGITFRLVVWEVAPTSTNTVYGIAVHPTNGKLYRISSINNVKSAEIFSPDGLDATVSGQTLVLTKKEG